MSGKISCLFVIGLFLVTVSNAEILKTSALKKTYQYTCKRNIFSPESSYNERGVSDSQPIEPPVKTENQIEEEAKFEEEVRHSVFYEGYSVKKSLIHGLITVNGEFFVVRDGDLILDKIKIMKIGRKSISVKIEEKTFEVILKGVE